MKKGVERPKALSPWEELEAATTHQAVRNVAARLDEVPHVDRPSFSKSLHQRRQQVWRREPHRMTEEQYRELADSDGGLCLGCGRLRWHGCEPDARRIECEECEERLVCGADYAMLGGAIVLDESAADGWPCPTCGGAVTVSSRRGDMLFGICKECTAIDSRKVDP